jgi:hypothetical protein
MNLMKQVSIIMIIAMVLISFTFSAATVSANDPNQEEDYIMGDVSTLTADFNLVVTVSDSVGQQYENGVPNVSGICTFRVALQDGATNTNGYDVSLFENNKFICLFKGRSLPFTTKRNYRGTIDGNYTITFVARNHTGKIGKGEVEISVRH